MKGDLGSQLSDIFKKGLEADPKAARSLASALSSHINDQQDGHTKAEANYHTATDSKRECGTCDNMVDDHTCQIVSGNISADGTCDFWQGDSQDSTSQSDSSQTDVQPADSGGY